MFSRGSKKVQIPVPELYVLYTGDRKDRPKKITLKESFFGGAGCLDVEAKMLYDGKQGDIINQFVRFTKVFDEQRRLCDNPRKAVKETIRICKDENVLKEYLEREEAAVVMFTFADQEMATKLTMEEERREGGDSRARETAKRMIRRGKQTLQEIAEDTGLQLSEVEQLAGVAMV